MDDIVSTFKDLKPHIIFFSFMHTVVAYLLQDTYTLCVCRIVSPQSYEDNIQGDLKFSTMPKTTCAVHVEESEIQPVNFNLVELKNCSELHTPGYGASPASFDWNKAN